MNKAKIKSNLISFGVAILVALVICAAVVAIHFLTPQSSASAEVDFVVANSTYQNVSYHSTEHSPVIPENLSSSGTISLPFRIQYMSQNVLIEDSSFAYTFFYSGSNVQGRTYDYSFIFGDNYSVSLNFTIFEQFATYYLSSVWFDENDSSIDDGDLKITFTASPGNDSAAQWFWDIIKYCVDDSTPAPIPWPSVLPSNTNADDVVTSIVAQSYYYNVESYFTDNNNNDDYSIGAGLYMNNVTADYNFTVTYGGVAYSGSTVKVYYREDTSVAKALSIVTFEGTSQSNTTVTLKCWSYATLISNVYTTYNYWTDGSDDTVKLADYSVSVRFLSLPAVATDEGWIAYSVLSSGLIDSPPVPTRSFSLTTGEYSGLGSYDGFVPHTTFTLAPGAVSPIVFDLDIQYDDEVYHFDDVHVNSLQCDGTSIAYYFGLNESIYQDSAFVGTMTMTLALKVNSVSTAVRWEFFYSFLGDLIADNDLISYSDFVIDITALNTSVGIYSVMEQNLSAYITPFTTVFALVNSPLVSTEEMLFNIRGFLEEDYEQYTFLQYSFPISNPSYAPNADGTYSVYVEYNVSGGYGSPVLLQRTWLYNNVNYITIAAPQNCTSIRIRYNAFSAAYTTFDSTHNTVFWNAFVANGEQMNELVVFTNDTAYRQGYDAGYRTGYNSGSTDGNNLMSLVWFTFELPFKLLFGEYDRDSLSPTYGRYVGGLFNFTFLGLDIRAFVLSVMSLCIVIAIVRLILARGK